MKTKMKRRVLVLFFLSLSISQIPIVMAPNQTAILVTSKPAYAIGEVVYFTLTNTGTEPIEGTCSDPWTIYKDVNGKWEEVYTPPRGEETRWATYPMRCRTWSWEQESNTTVTVDFGTYKVEVSPENAGTWSATFTIEETLSPSSVPILVTSKPVYAYGEIVYFTLINAGTVPIGETYSSPWTIYKDVGGTWKHVYAPSYRHVSWTINPGESRSWKWNPLFEQDFDSPTVKVDAGTYKVEVDITKAGTSSATFIIEEPAPGSCSGSLFLGIFVLMGLFLRTRIH